MAQTVIIHLANEDPILAEVEDVDNLGGSALECMNLRRRDGKQVQPISNSHFARLGLPNPSQTSGFDNPEGAIPAKSDYSTAIMRIAGSP